MSPLTIVSGIYKGRKIITPEGTGFRPMSGKVRNALFNILGEKLRGAKLLDLFAGSGAIGIEALSRGASKVCFVDRDTSVLSAAIRSICPDADVEIISGDVAKQIEFLSEKGNIFDVIVLDPPYEDDVSELVQRGELSGLVAGNGYLVLSHSSRSTAPELSPAMKFVKSSKFGDTMLTTYTKD